MKNRSKYKGEISEQNVVRTELILAIVIEIFRKKHNFLYDSIQKFGQSAYACTSLIIVSHRATHVSQLTSSCDFEIYRLKLKYAGKSVGLFAILYDKLLNRESKMSGTERA